MKKLLALFFVLFFVSSSYALELKANGSYRIRMFNTWHGGNDYGMNNGWYFGNSGEDEDDSFFDQEFKLKFTADNGDGVRGVLMFEAGNSVWGDENDYTRLGAEKGNDGDSNVEVNAAYIEIDKAVYAKAGLFKFSTPNSVILSDELAGILVGKDFGNIAVNLLYSKLYDGNNDKRGVDNNNDADLYGVMVPVKTDYFNVTPYFLYASIENKGMLGGSMGNVGNMRGFYRGADDYNLLGYDIPNNEFQQNYGNADAWWIGAAFDGKMPYGNGVDWKLHGVYGDAKIDGKRGNDNVDMEGFLIDGSLTYVYDRYKFDVYGLYSSGDDPDDLLPTVAPDYLEYSTYAPLFFDGLGMGDYAVDPAGYSMIGGQVTFNTIERLKHIFDVAYIWNMLDDKYAKNDDTRDNPRFWFDNFVQVAFVSEYQIAEGTTLSMLAGALVPDANKDDSGKKYEDDTAYAINFKLQYNF